MDLAAADSGGVAESEPLLAPCIISSAISDTGSFSGGTFGADSVSCTQANFIWYIPGNIERKFLL